MKTEANATPRVGLIGLGAMGSGMAQSIRRAGLAPGVFDVRPGVAQAFAQDGGTAHASAAELAAASDVVVCVVVNAAQTEDVLFGSGGVAKAMRSSRVSSVSSNLRLGSVLRSTASCSWKYPRACGWTVIPARSP